MTTKLPNAGCRLSIDRGGVPPCRSGGREQLVGGTPCTPHVVPYSALAAPYWRRGGFSMVELLVAMTLLTLVVFALMAVFSSTQQAFRASVTQTGVMEGSRSAMEMMVNDLRTMTPSDGAYAISGNFSGTSVISTNPVNFVSLDNSYASCSYSSGGGTLMYKPFQQPLPGSSQMRPNVLNYFFVLGRLNMKWTGVGYVVNATNTAPLYPLYRFYAETNIAISPVTLYWAFVNAINQSQWTNMSHVLDGVVDLTVRPFDRTGYRMTNYNCIVSSGQGLSGQTNFYNNVWFLPFPPSPIWGEVGCMFFSNAVPASVELQMGIVEDRTLERTESFGSPGGVTTIQSNYLAQQSGHVHVFRQRVTIPNLDPSAYH
jgi:type II secretory pathway pseudopilin PulG